MGKLKTHKGTARRIKRTGTGKLMHFRAGRRHLLSSKPAKRMRRLRKTRELSPVHKQMISRLLPY